MFNFRNVQLTVWRRRNFASCHWSVSGDSQLETLIVGQQAGMRYYRKEYFQEGEMKSDEGKLLWLNLSLILSDLCFPFPLACYGSSRLQLFHSDEQRSPLSPRDTP